MTPIAPMRLELSLSADRLTASLCRDAPGRSPLLPSAQATYDAGLVAERSRALHDELARAVRYGGSPDGPDTLARLGGLLFDEVLPGSVKSALRQAVDGPALRSRPLTLVLDEALVAVPWELMHTGQRFLGRACRVGRLVRSQRPVLGRRRPRPDGPWRMGVVCDPRGDLLGAYYEGVTLRDELGARSDATTRALTVELRSTEVRVADAKALIQDYDVLHYAGHAEVRPDCPEDSGWLCYDGALTAQSVLALAGGRPLPRLVFANACGSGRVDGPYQAAEAADGDDGRAEAVYSLASAFLLGGVGHFVGTLWDVPDEPACHFALAFYAALSQGAPLGDAMGEGQQALRARYGDDDVVWASWVLYGDPTVPCVPAPASRARAHADRPGSSRRAPPTAPSPRPLGAPRRPGLARVRGASSPARSTSLWIDPLGGPQPLEAARGRRWLFATATALGMAAVLGAVALATDLASADARSMTGDLREGPVIGLLDDHEAFRAPRRLSAIEPTAVAADPDGEASQAPSRAFAAVSRHARPVPVPASPPTPSARMSQGPELEPTVLSVDAADAQLQLVVQSPHEDGFDVQPVTSGATLHSWDNFQLRLRVREPAHATLWHVESQGGVSRVHPAGDQVTVPVAAGRWHTLPDGDTWYYLDDRRGTERFYLATRARASSVEEADALLADVARLGKALSARRKAARDARAAAAEPMVVRGLGGTREAPAPITARSEADLLVALEDLLSTHYDTVRLVEVDHR